MRRTGMKLLLFFLETQILFKEIEWKLSFFLLFDVDGIHDHNQTNSKLLIEITKINNR